MSADAAPPWRYLNDIPQGKIIKTYPIADTGGAILASLERVYQRNNDARTRVTDSMPESNSTATKAHNITIQGEKKKKRNWRTR
jgi:hypothetical protein